MTVTVTTFHGAALVSDPVESVVVPFDDIPAVIAGLLVAQDSLADAR